MMYARLKKSLSCCLAGILSIGIFVASPLAASAADVSIAANPVEACVSESIKENDAYIDANYEKLFDEKAMEDPLFSARIDALTCDAEKTGESNDSAEFSSIDYVIQDKEIPVDGDTNLRAVTTAAAVLSTASPGGSQEKNDYDKYYAVKAYTTIYYLTKVESNVTYYLISEISGGYNILDQTVQLRSQKVTYKQEGWNLTNGYVCVGPKDKEVSTSSWSFNPGFTEYVKPSQGYLAYGANYSFTVVRNGGSSSWSFLLQNQL